MITDTNITYLPNKSISFTKKTYFFIKKAHLLKRAESHINIFSTNQLKIDRK